MEHQQVLDQVIKIIKDHTKLNAVDKLDTFDKLITDSLDKLEIVLALEEEFDIEIDDNIADFLDTTVFAAATAICDEITALEGIVSSVPASTGAFTFEEMVAGLAKDGKKICDEMNSAKSIALANALTLALETSRYVDRVKKLVVYNKEAEPVVRHAPVDTNIGHKATPEQMHKLHMAIGLFGEAGEILEAVVAEIETGVCDKPNEVEESGDLGFYHEGYRQACGFTREVAQTANIDKLGKRYQGHKYTDAQAQARADKILAPEEVAANLKKQGIHVHVADCENGGKEILVAGDKMMKQGFGSIKKSSDQHESPRAPLELNPHAFGSSKILNPDAFVPQSLADADSRDIFVR